MEYIEYRGIALSNPANNNNVSSGVAIVCQQIVFHPAHHHCIYF